MGLNYPLDIDAWAAWQRRQNTLRWAKGEARALVGRLRGGAAEQEGPVGGVLYTRGAVPRVLIVLDSFSPTSRNSLLEPLKYLENVGVALWVPEDASEYLNGQYATERYSRDAWTEQEVTGDQLQGLLPGVRVVLSLGHYLARGAPPTSSRGRLALSTGSYSTVCWCRRHRPCRLAQPCWRSARLTQNSGLRVAAT